MARVKGLEPSTSSVTGWGPTTEKPGTQGADDEVPGRANTGANSGESEAPAARPPTDPDLAVIVDAWSALPAALRAGIAAMVRAASG